MSTPDYYSYLIRIWNRDHLLEDTWMASLEDPCTKQTCYFSRIEDLITHLTSITCDKASSQKLTKNTNK